MSRLYGQFPFNAYRRLVNDLGLVGTVVKVMLCTSAYIPNQNTHQSRADITNEVVGVGYTAGGRTLANKSLTYANRVTTFTADPVEWTNSTITARYAVIYDDTPVANADKRLIGWIDLGSDRISSEGTFRINWNASGIFTSTVA